MNATNPTCVAFIPARAGSKRVQGKNVRPLDGHPLLAYSIRAAVESGVFSRVILSTDSEEYAAIGRHYGADVPFLRPAAFAADRSPDIDWVEYTLRRLADEGHTWDAYSLLRPTSPFRQPETIQRAWNAFRTAKEIDSLRAIERCAQHPGKMWVIQGEVMFPLFPFHQEGLPWHSSPYQSLPEIYIQNASLEIAWCAMTLTTHSIAGQRILPFVTEGMEGFDINQPEDLELAEFLVQRGRGALPPIAVAPYPIPPANS